MDELPENAGRPAPQEVKKPDQLTSWLEDNQPDPFSEESTIRVKVPESAIGELVVTDLLGRIIRQYNLSQGEHTVLIKAKEFENGLYSYSLMVNGSVVKSYRMMIMK